MLNFIAMRYSIIVIILLILSLIFAFQNTQAISLKFLFWSFDGSEAFIIILTLFAGLIIGILLMAQRLYIKNKEVKNMRKQFLEIGKIE